MPNILYRWNDLYNIYKSWNGRGEEHREQHEYKNEMIEVEFLCFYMWKCYFDEECGWWDTYQERKTH